MPWSEKACQPQRHRGAETHRRPGRNPKARPAVPDQPPTVLIRRVFSRARRPRIPPRSSGVAGGRTAGALRPTLPRSLCPGPPGSPSLRSVPSPRPSPPGRGERAKGEGDSDRDWRLLADPGRGRTALWEGARQRSGAAKGGNHRCEHRPPGRSREAAPSKEKCLASERSPLRLPQASAGHLQRRRVAGPEAARSKRFSGSSRLVVQTVSCISHLWGGVLCASVSLW